MDISDIAGMAILSTPSLPHWPKPEDYGHSYYLTVNCYIPPAEFGKWIEVGDEVKIIGKKTFPTFTM